MQTSSTVQLTTNVSVGSLLVITIHYIHLFYETEHSVSCINRLFILVLFLTLLETKLQKQYICLLRNLIELAYLANVLNQLANYYGLTPRWTTNTAQIAT